MTEKGLGGSVGAARKWLAAVEVGEGMHCTNLTVFPLFWKGETNVAGAEEPPSWSGDTGGVGQKARYRLLSEAIEAEQARVEETSEAGDVPLLAVRNDGTVPVLIPEGEILIGAKQNRTVNLTLLVAAKTQMQMPVSCIEAGRWSRTSPHFYAKAWAHPKLRELKVRSAQSYRRETGMARSDQGAIWKEVDDHLVACDIPAPTRDLALSFEAADVVTSDYRDQIEMPREACGFLAARGGAVVGLDLFDAPETLHKLWRRMSDAYFMEASREGRHEKRTSERVAEEFLASVEKHLAPAGEQPQLGFEMELVNGALSGSALWYDGAICHLSAFSNLN